MTRDELLAACQAMAPSFRYQRVALDDGGVLLKATCNLPSPHEHSVQLTKAQADRADDVEEHVLESALAYLQGAAKK